METSIRKHRRAANFCNTAWIFLIKGIQQERGIPKAYTIVEKLRGIKDITKAGQTRDRDLTVQRRKWKVERRVWKDDEIFKTLSQEVRLSLVDEQGIKLCYRGNK